MNEYSHSHPSRCMSGSSVATCLPRCIAVASPARRTPVPRRAPGCTHSAPSATAPAVSRPSAAGTQRQPTTKPHLASLVSLSNHTPANPTRPKTPNPRLSPHPLPRPIPVLSPLPTPLPPLTSLPSTLSPSCPSHFSLLSPHSSPSPAPHFPRPFLTTPRTAARASRTLPSRPALLALQSTHALRAMPALLAPPFTRARSPHLPGRPRTVAVHVARQEPPATTPSPIPSPQPRSTSDDRSPRPTRRALPEPPSPVPAPTTPRPTPPPGTHVDCMSYSLNQRTNASLHTPITRYLTTPRAAAPTTWRSSSGWRKTCWTRRCGRPRPAGPCRARRRACADSGPAFRPCGRPASCWQPRARTSPRWRRPCRGCP